MFEAKPAFLLDFDGLLVDSEPLHFEAFRRAFARFGHTLNKEEYWLYFTHLGEGPEGEKIRHQLMDIPVDVILKDKKTIFSALCAAHPPVPRPGALDLLELLRISNWPHTIASNTDTEDLALMCTHFTGSRLPLMTGGNGLQPKPAPDIYLAAAASLGRKPDACVAVEDTLKGLRSAQAAGISCIVVPGPQTAQFAFPGAWKIFSSLEEIVKTLEHEWGNRAL